MTNVTREIFRIEERCSKNKCLTSTLSSLSLWTMTGRTETSVKSACKDWVAMAMKKRNLITPFKGNNLYNQNFASKLPVKFSFKSSQLLHASSNLTFGSWSSTPAIASYHRHPLLNDSQLYCNHVNDIAILQWRTQPKTKSSWCQLPGRCPFPLQRAQGHKLARSLRCSQSPPPIWIFQEILTYNKYFFNFFSRSTTNVQYPHKCYLPTIIIEIRRTFFFWMT